MRLILIRPVCCRSRSSTDSVRLADSTSAPTGRRRCAWPDAADARDGEHAVLASATSVRRRGHYDWFVRVRPPGARRVRRLLLLEEVRRAAQLHVPLSCMSHSAFGLGLCLSCVPPGTARHATCMSRIAGAAHRLRYSVYRPMLVPSSALSLCVCTHLSD